MHSRLSSARFPKACLVLAIDPRQHASVASQSWLNHGAVGWYVPCRFDALVDLACHQRMANFGVQQLVTNLAWLWKSDADDRQAWPYLAHCTQGTSGPGPDETIHQFHDRMLIAGNVPEVSISAHLSS